VLEDCADRLGLRDWNPVAAGTLSKRLSVSISGSCLFPPRLEICWVVCFPYYGSSRAPSCFNVRRLIHRSLPDSMDDPI